MRVYEIPRRHGSSFGVVVPGFDPRTGRKNRTRKVIPGVHDRDLAEKIAAEIQSLIDAAKTPDKPSGTTFAGFALTWLAARESDWKPTTLRRNEQALRSHLLPWFGSKELAAIVVVDIQQYKAAAMRRTVGKKKKRPVSPKTIANELGVLSRMLQDAMDWDLIARNPSRKVAPPLFERDARETRAWTADEARRFLATVAREAPSWYAMYLFALKTGLRLGELAALEKGDVDLESGVVRVRRSLSRGHLTTPKSGRMREIPLDAELVSAMREHMATVRRGHVFTAMDGRDLDSNRVKSVFRRCSRAAKVTTIRFHDLRHTAATLAMQAGVPQRVVQTFLGHADGKTTERYTHVNLEAMRVELARVPSLGPADTGKPSAPK